MSSTPSSSSTGSPVIKPNTLIASGTPIGVDVGKRNLLTLAPVAAGASLEESRVITGPDVDDLYDDLCRRQKEAVELEALVSEDHQLDQGVLHPTTEAAVDGLHSMIEKAIENALSYAESFEMPVLVHERLSYHERTLAECVASGSEVDVWLYPTIQRSLVEQAQRRGIPAVFTSNKYTTRACHVCDQFARVERKTITCTTEDCPVDEVCRDRSAAASIARRVAPAGGTR